MQQQRIYTGLTLDCTSRRKVFRATNTPTEASHPEFGAVIGPFRTVRAAKLMAEYGAGSNPHLTCVADAERISKQQSINL